MILVKVFLINILNLIYTRPLTLHQFHCRVSSVLNSAIYENHCATFNWKGNIDVTGGWSSQFELFENPWLVTIETCNICPQCTINYDYMYIVPCTGNGSQESTHWVDSASTDDERRYHVNESCQVIIQKAQDDDKQNKNTQHNMHWTPQYASKHK